jgi:hypothetical protein
MYGAWSHPHIQYQDTSCTPVLILTPLYIYYGLGPCFLANTQLLSVNCSLETIHSLEKLQTFLSLRIKGTICALLCHHA